MTDNTEITREALPQDLRSILKELDRTDEEARQLVSALNDDQLNWHPGGGAGWSVAQCLGHLAQMNAVYTNALRAAIGEANQKSTAGTGRSIRPGWFGRWFIRSLEPPPRLKMKSPKPGRPPAHRSGQEVLSAFLASHDELRALVHEAKALDLNRIRFKNPFIGVLRFTVGTGLLIIGAHDRRHLWQAQQVRTAMPKNNSYH